MTFGEKIRKLRTDNQMNQDELAEKLFVTRTAISKWETGKGYPSIDSLKQLSNLFHVSIDDLISDEDVESKRVLDDQRARMFYWIAIGFLALTLAASLIAYFAHVRWVSILSMIGMVGYVACAFLAKPRYKKVDAKKYIVTYILSRVVILAIVVGTIIYTIVTMQ